MHYYRTRVRAVKENDVSCPIAVVINTFRSALESHLRSLSWHMKILRMPVRGDWSLGGAWMDLSVATLPTVTLRWPSPL